MLLIIFIISIKIGYSQTGNLQGQVTDGIKPIPFANIFIFNTGIGTSTDKDGTFHIKNIPSGKYQIRFSAIGYETVDKFISIIPNKTVEINIQLKSKIIELPSVEITEEKIQELNDTQTSFLDVSPRQAKILPGAAEDLFRTLQALPGIVSPNDFSSQLIVRGSGPDQNLIIIDDVEIFNPYRLYSSISMFNPDAIDNINLITGGFPAIYGDRLSAVLDVTNRQGDLNDNFKALINTSITDANLVIEGKNPFNLKGSWLFNSRRTYYDLIVEPIVKKANLIDERTSFPNFYDLQTKIVLGPFNGHKFLINGILSRDGVNIISGKNRKTADSIGVFNLTSNNVASIAWHYLPSNNFFNKLILSYYENVGNTDFDSKVLDPSLNRNSFENILPDTLAQYLVNLKFDANFNYSKVSFDNKSTYIWDDQTLDFGFGADFIKAISNFIFKLDPQLQAIFNSDPRRRSSLSDLFDSKNYNKVRFYLQNKFKVTDNFFITPGIRYDYYQLLEKHYLSPRVSLSYALNHLTTLRAAFGLYYQSPGYERGVDQRIFFNFNDKFTKTLQSEKATHYVIGIERWINEQWNFKVETYYKKFDNLIVPKKVFGTQFHTELIPGRDPLLASSWTRPVPFASDSITQIPINNSYGNAVGLEFLLAKKNIYQNSKLNGWISYSLAYANRYENGVKSPFEFDQRHTVNIVLNYEFNSWFYVGLRWQYGSGFPINTPIGISPRIIYIDSNNDGILDTPIIATRRSTSSNNSDGNVIFDVKYDRRKFNDRKPEYHRLDLRFNFLTKFWNSDWIFYLDIINVYNRKNVIGYDYYIDNDLTLVREQTNMFPILPTFGISVQF